MHKYMIEPRHKFDWAQGETVTTYVVGHYASGEWIEIAAGLNLDNAIEVARALNTSLKGY